ncbi:MAG: hypothetical protein EPN88_02810 [Bacteroidetes bacterium]|nr:MAG: hypothetical protein EPN88_02810 [Bacteroidota bacterium]
MQILLQLWLPIIAIVISVVSLIISYFSYRTGHKSFSLSLNPILKVRFIVDRNKKIYNLSLLNDGQINIYEIKIRLIWRLLSKDFKQLTAIHSKNDWNCIEVLHKNESKVFIIPNDEIERSFQSESIYIAKNINPLGSALSVLVSFRRETDRKKYREAKTIFFFRDSQTNEIGDMDPDELGINYWINAANKIGEFDKDLDF